MDNFIDEIRELKRRIEELEKRNVPISSIPGEANYGENIGTSGVGVYKGKSGVVLQFKKINAGSNKITITDDTNNNEVDIDIDETKIDHANLTNLNSTNYSHLTSSEKTDLLNNSHTHSNKSLLDTYTQTESDLADAVSKKHDRLHSLTSTSDHSSATGTDKGKYLKTNPTTGNPELVSLSVVAESGSYNDLTDKPTIPTSHTQLTDIGTYTHSQIDGHINNTNNPHNVTKSQVGLGNVQNVDTTNASNITSGTLDGDRLPSMSSTKKGAVPPTGTPSGKFLKDDGTWATPSGSGNVSGSGTTNYLPKWTDTTTLGNSVVYENNNKIGIGSTSPTAKLHIEDTPGSDVPVFFVKNLTSTTWVHGFQMLAPNLTSGQYFYWTLGKVASNYNRGAFTYYHAGDGNTNNRMSIGFYGADNLLNVLANGNVGIGTTTPQNKFSVGSSSQFQINSNGNIVKINNISYSFPSTQGSSNTYLKNDGSGNLTWSTISVGDNITINGTAVTDANFDDNTPSAPAGGVNVKWQNDASSPANISAYLPIGTSLIDALRHKPFYYTDFLGPASAGNVEAAYPFDFAVISSGTQAKIAGEANHPGILRISSSTTANSGGYVLTDLTAFLIAGGECFELVFQHRVSSGTNTTIRFGYLDTNTSADATDGVYFEIPADSLDLVGKTASNSTRSTTSSSYTLSVNTWYRARLVVNSDATRVDFYLFSSSGTQLWTDYLTTNIPTGSGRNTGAGVIATNSGTTATLLCYLDWMAVWFDGRALTR